MSSPGGNWPFKSDPDHVHVNPETGYCPELDVVLPGYERPREPTEFAGVRAKHKGYGWGSLYKNAKSATHMLVKANGRRFLVRSLDEIVEWDNNQDAVQPRGETP